MFCANCGAQLNGALKFCPRCGNKLREIPGVVQEPAPSALKGLPEEMQNDLLEQQVSVVSEKVSAAMEPIETTTAPSEPAENTGQSIEVLKSQITEELLQDRSFIQKVTERIATQVPERGGSDDADCPEEETGMGFDFDEDMLLSGMSMFETQI